MRKFRLPSAPPFLSADRFQGFLRPPDFRGISRLRLLEPGPEDGERSGRRGGETRRRPKPSGSRGPPRIHAQSVSRARHWKSRSANPICKLVEHAAGRPEQRERRHVRRASRSVHRRGWTKVSPTRLRHLPASSQHVPASASSCRMATPAHSSETAPDLLRGFARFEASRGVHNEPQTIRRSDHRGPAGGGAY